MRTTQQQVPARRRSPLGLHLLPRAVLLGALASATIVVPVVSAGSAQDASQGAGVEMAQAGVPTTYEVLASTEQQTTPTSLLAAVPGATRVSDTVSRSVERDPLPGCDGEPRSTGSNGQIPSSDLCQLWDPAHSLRGDAAVAISELNLGYRAAFGRDLCLTDSYRTLASQRRLASTKPGLAATPGRSNHGWGLAVDLCGSEHRTTATWNWLNENAPVYGWDNPNWARRGGSGPYEPWHWEYVPGTTAMDTNWDD
ncbi:D-alanyl-D-alanine carboxypeptidase family protein [Actinotalea sp. K2]|uniref:M15 family metallopeptidase n=1 Tax=Actinotalea sp. K2 TaxID=2939438 RepID=UPI00201837C8|nr:M15 family metallopeptidase [Actinotalea sp. K2]